jgi:aryl-alcohol dehydrogenase-like predicted oxidoreductase
LKIHYTRENETDNAIVTRVEDIAKKHGVSMAIVGMAWVMKQGANPIVGLNSENRIDEAIAAIDFELSDEDAKYIEEPYLPKRVIGM